MFYSKPAPLPTQECCRAARNRLARQHLIGQRHIRIDRVEGLINEVVCSAVNLQRQRAIFPDHTVLTGRVCVTAALTVLLAAGVSAPAATISLAIGELDPTSTRQGWGQLLVDERVTGGPLQIGDRHFTTGLGTHANSEIVYDLGGAYEQFESWVGVDAAMRDYKEASVIFKVIADGRGLFDSGVMRANTPARRVRVPVTGVNELKLVVTDAGDGINCDHADWADAFLFAETGISRTQSTKPTATAYRLSSSGMTLNLSSSGEITALRLAGAGRARISAGTELVGCTNEGNISFQKLAGGGVEFQRTLVHRATGDRATLVERLTSGTDSVRWELSIQGLGKPWTTAIETHVTWPVVSSNALRFWTAWDQPGRAAPASGESWTDPLVLSPLANVRLSYGGNPWDEVDNTPYAAGGRFAIPLVMLADPQRNRALSIILSPEDRILEMALTVRRNGSVKFSRRDHRISSDRPVKFALDLVTHEADWRASLGWMIRRYPDYFDPPNARAAEIAGLAAYSDWEGELEVAKLRQMGFRVNWKASYDFPYMGMFLPPIADDELYTRFAKGNKTSIAQLRDYSRRMRAMGFHVLNYFNVTEFGGTTGMPAQADPSLAAADRWKNVHNFVDMEIPDGILHRFGGGLYGSWEGCVVMDCGAPNYRAFLLDQARRHIEKLPDSSGICIDRMDWLRLYNFRADDGVSWRRGGPARALSISWRDLLAELGPMFHRADKVIFGNATVNRTDLMREMDGIYHELGNVGAELNGSALQCVRKPLMVWTPDEKTLGANPDAYFQRHLYLGAYPTAPLPANDHTINPSPAVDRWYLDYGPLFQAFRGRRWVLLAHAVEVDNKRAKANLFETSHGLIAPVCFGDTNTSVALVIRNLSKLNLHGKDLLCDALQPAGEIPITLKASARKDALRIDVPLKRGCAVVRIFTRP